MPTADGQVAMVVGGGGAIGRSIAAELARRGTHVALVGRSQDTLDEAAATIGDGATALAADATDRAALADVVSRVEREVGPVDLLVNAVGGARPLAPAWEADAGEWWHAVEVNLRTAFLTSHVVLPGMVQRRSGRIVHMTSNAGAFRWPYASAYSVAKAGVIKLVENLAVETRKYRVSVFSIDPGLLRVGMTEDLLTADVPEDSPVAIVGRWFRGELDAGREVPPERAAELVAYVAGGAADALSGRHWTVYDDVERLVAHAKDIQRRDLYALRTRELPEDER